MKDLNDIQVFVEVVKAGSFTKAAQSLGLPISTASDRVRALEANLGVSLIIRTTRRLQLTDSGQRFFDNASVAMDNLLLAAETAVQCSQEPRGTLRITAPTDYAAAAIAKAVKEYHKHYPSVKIDLVTTNRVVDIVGEKFDIAIRGGFLKDSSLLSRRIGLGQILLVAQPAYLAQSPVIEEMNDLHKHSCIAYAPRELDREPMPWELKNLKGQTKRIKPEFRVYANSFQSVVDFAKAGLGIAYVPESMVAAEVRAGDLQRVLPDWTTDLVPISLVYAKAAVDLPKVQRMIPLLEKQLKSLLLERL